MNDTVCIVTTLRAPVDMTKRFVNYYLNTGVDHMFLFFDFDDPAIEALSRYSQTTCVRCDADYWSDHGLAADASLEDRQKCNATVAFKLARESGLNWMIHIDSDELIYTEEPIRVHLARVSQRIKAVRIMTCEAVPEKIKYNSIFDEISLFKVIPTRLQKYRAYLSGCGSTFFRGEFFRGHLVGKTAFRTNADFSLIGIHGPIVPGQRTLPKNMLSDVKLLHFESCTFEEWKNKWGRICERGVIRREMRKNRIRQYESFVALYKKGADGKLAELYRRLYLLSDREKKILSKIGLLECIHLDKRLFSRAE
jgi:hypothetical protein